MKINWILIMKYKHIKWIIKRKELFQIKLNLAKIGKWSLGHVLLGNNYGFSSNILSTLSTINWSL